MTGSAFEIDLEQILAHEDFVRRLARGLLFDAHRVDDVVQQTWVAALRNPPSQPGALRAWLAGVVRRVAANEVRGEVRRARRERHAAERERELPSADEVLAREERRREVVDALAALAEPYRTAVALRYLEGLEPVEIAQRQGVPAATVRTRVRRGLDQMRAHLDRKHGGERIDWCLGLVPLARGSDAATAGVATTLITTWTIAMKKLSIAAAALLVAALAVFAWPRDDALPPSTTTAGPAQPARVAQGSGVDSPGELPEPSARAAVTTSGGDVATVFRGGLRGRLIAPDGAPLGGAEVHAYGFDGPMLFVGGERLPRRDARTDSTGRFEFADLPTRARCALLADAEGDLRQLVPIAATVEPGLVVELGDLVLESRAVLTGLVVGPDGEPRAGVEVVAADIPALVFAALPVDRFVPENGALLTLPRPTAAERGAGGDYRSRLQSHLAFALIRDAFDPLDPNYVPVVLDGTPLRELWDMLPIARTTTDADGRFRLSGVAPGNNVLAARVPGFPSVVRAGLRVTPRREFDIGTLRLTEGEELYGRVVDVRGHGVADAEVRVATIGSIGFRGVAPCEPVVHADSEGRFAVAGLPRGKVCVAARRGSSEPWTVLGPVATDSDVVLELPANVSLTVDLKLPAGIDGAGVRVHARPNPPLGELLRVGMLGEAGKLEVAVRADGKLDVGPLAPGIWTLRFEVPGCAPELRVVDLPADTDLAVELRGLVDHAVRVLTADGRGCEGAEVFVVDPTDLEAQRVLISDYGLPQWPIAVPGPPVRTDSGGACKVAAPRSGAMLVARHPLHGSTAVELQPDGPDEIVLRLRASGTLEGRVVDHRGDGPDPRGLRVFVSPADSPRTDSAPLVDVGARPDADGHFRIEGLATGTYDVEIRSALPRSLTISSLVPFLRSQSGGLFVDTGTLAERSVVVEPGAIAMVGFELGGHDANRGGVRGVATHDGRPAEGFTVWLREREQDGTFISDSGWEFRSRATLDEHGGFVVDDLPARRCWLGLRDGAGGPFVYVWTVDVEAGASSVVRADVQVGTVRGVLRDPDGAPAPRAEVWFSGTGASELLAFAAETDDRGSFVLRDAPVGTYSVSVNERHLMVAPEPVEVFAGIGTPPLELAGRARYQLEVRMVGETVPPKAFVRIELRHAASGRGNSYGGARDRSAKFALEQPGTYRLRVWFDGRTYEAVPATVEVVDPDTAIEIRQGRQLEDGR